LRRFTVWARSSYLHHLLGYNHPLSQFFELGEFLNKHFNSLKKTSDIPCVAKAMHCRPPIFGF
jgi:hypothetical protein